MELHFDRNHCRDWLAFFQCRVKPPTAHCFHSLLVESHAERFDHFDIAWQSINSDNQGQDAGALVAGFARLLRELGKSLSLDSRRADAPAYWFDSWRRRRELPVRTKWHQHGDGKTQSGNRLRSHIARKSSTRRDSFRTD